MPHRRSLSTPARRAGDHDDRCALDRFRPRHGRTGQLLLSPPVILGAVVRSRSAGLFADGIPEGLGAALVIGVVTSAISGWIAVWGTLALVRNYSFTPFVVYRIVLGVVVLIAVAAGA
ncbi:MAG: undecaprenyl-diphosphate phosphatase [Ilumatobacteraceae bacterium]